MDVASVPSYNQRRGWLSPASPLLVYRTLEMLTMAMWASKVYLRWYKSFNTRYDEPDQRDKNPLTWEMFVAEAIPGVAARQEHFPFVEVRLNARIATIVGANESGKSHLLSAVEKIAHGRSTTETGFEKYDLHHLCRYCGLDGLNENVWPRIGIEVTFQHDTEYSTCLERCSLPPQASIPEARNRRLRFLMDGGSPAAEFVQVYNHAGNSVGAVSKERWFEAAQTALPAVHYVHSRLALSNEIHISQLLDMYGGEKPTPAPEPLHLHGLADELLTLQLAKGQQIDDATATSWDEHKKKVTERTLGPIPGKTLERQLFEQILRVPVEILRRIEALNSTNRGFVERLLDEINHRLNEALDLSQFWQQDDDFSLRIEYKGGFFYFRITDRTGASYTFNERSSGLRYFLSYYIQTKAIRDSIGDNGAIVVMDEPDSYLSAAGQRNLLTVFEMLATPDAHDRRCQLIYTTHSPFLINRNFPQRITLVRKGDGTEGTQVVENASTRLYEPVRTGLGIESADTLFMGSCNVVLEEISAQKVFVSAIQRFGKETEIDDMLDLNRSTLVSASGVYDIARLLRTAARSKEKRPTVVVLIDGDSSGQVVAQQLPAERLIAAKYVTTLADIELTPSWNSQPKELEDLIPPAMLSFAIVDYAETRWRQTCDHQTILSDLNSGQDGDAMSARLVAAIRNAVGADCANVEDIVLKAGVFDTFCHLLTDTSEFEAEKDELPQMLKEFEQVMRSICDRLRSMLADAQQDTRRDRLRKNVRLHIEQLRLTHRQRGTRADVARCLTRIDDECIYSTDNAKQTRLNALYLMKLLEGKTRNAGDPVNMAEWHELFDKLWNEPWHTGWK
jgi:predicted ATPase